MKCFIIVFALCSAMCVSAAYVKPKINTTDPEVLAKALAEAEKPEQKMHVELIQSFNSTKVNSFSDLVKKVSIIGDKYSIKSEQKISFIKRFAFYRLDCQQFLSQACIYCLENPSKLDRIFFINSTTKKFFTPAQLYAGSLRCLQTVNTTLLPREAVLLVTNLVEYSGTLDPAAVKSDLAQLNRRYSLLLIKDKAAWTPVVQTIRTALETF